jgi:hypothetical protein
MAKILKRTSFSLLRTNPRLSTNIKIVADSRNKIYLESIDADPLLSKSIYKGFEISPNGSYSFDLRRFYSQSGNQLPKNIAYSVFEEDASVEIKDRYKNQYDFTYGYGMYPKNSKIYSEEFSLFAPLWIEKDNIPEYFVIFKIDDPVTVNINDPNIISQAGGSTANFDTVEVLNTLVQDPSNFFENYVKKAKIIKAFDLSDRSSIGKYIRNHVNDSSFPESSLYVNFEKGKLTNWQGISYSAGGFCKIPEDIYKEYILTDKTVTENDDFITTGFRQYGVVCPNLLNLEFLFDDPDQTKYKFSRYFGLYVNAIELGKFILDPDRLYQDKDQEAQQLPRPISPDVGSPNNTIDQEQINERGIKIYPALKYQSGLTGPYSGRLISFSEIQNPRFAYVKDRNENFYSIDQVTNWESFYTISSTGPSGPIIATDSDYLRIKNKKVNWKNFSGFDPPFQYIPSSITDKKGKPGFSFDITGTVSPGDEIRIKYVDWTNPGSTGIIDFYTVDAVSTLPAGQASGLLFSINGTKKEIASAIAQAINNIEDYTEEQIFRAISKGSTVIVFTLVNSETWNKLKYSIFSNSSTFPFSLSNKYKQPIQQTYQPSPISVAPIQFGWYFEDNFVGGNNNPKSRIVIERKYVEEFRDDLDQIYVKTKTGFDTTAEYGLYLENPITNSLGDIVDFVDFDQYYVINLQNKNNEVDFGSSRKIGLYKFAKNSNGYLSILPIRDFDFDFHSTEYNKDADSSIESLRDWYLGPTGASYNWTNTQPIFDVSVIGSTGFNIINSILGPTSSFAIRKGFKRLSGYTDDLIDREDQISNEYDRLKENDIPQIAITSRVVPYINKWVYDNESVDVRENPYRLNSDQVFNYTNFSPAFEEYSSNPNFFTMEWPYLQKYPPYMSFEEKVNSFSYFDEDLFYPNVPTIGSSGSTAIYAGLTGGTGASANLLSIEEDYFLSYFTRETIGGSAINRDFRYSIFAYGDEVRFAETLFRGVKVIIKDRSEFSPINYNIESLRFLPSNRYNRYKFSAVLTYSSAGTNITFIKNDKWKSITLVIQADLEDSLLQYYDRDPVTGATGATHSFIDRSSLYTLQSKYRLSPGGTSLMYEDTQITGSIRGDTWRWETVVGVGFRVYGGPDQFGALPRFNKELTLNENGTYNPVTIVNPSNPALNYTFSQISDVRANSFLCQQITGPGFGTINPSTPNDLSTDGLTYPSAWAWWQVGINTSTFQYNPTYIGGGFNAYSRIFNEISFANVANLINSGSPDINYFEIDGSGKVSENTYAVELVPPDYPSKSSYLKAQPLKKRPTDRQSSDDIIGYDIVADSRMTVNQIARNRGGYNPKFRDIIKFVDTDDLKNENLTYYNIQILSDIGYWKDTNMGVIDNLYYNKVNVENPNIILQYSASSERSIYPLIGEIAIDYSNYFVFRSNWDPFYYWKYNKKDIKFPVIGTREPKEEKSFFGSKVISIPNEVRIETFPSGDQVFDTALPSLNNFSNSGKSIAVYKKTENRRDLLNVRVFTTLALQTYLINDGFDAEFKKYVNPNYSFGSVDLEDDVKTYIEENIFERYSIKEIIFWERFWERGNSYPQIQYQLTDVQKIQAGYVRSNSFTTRNLSYGGLDFDLIYSIPKDRNSSIAFSVVLEKK